MHNPTKKKEFELKYSISFTFYLNFRLKYHHDKNNYPPSSPSSKYFR